MPGAIGVILAGLGAGEAGASAGTTLAASLATLLGENVLPGILGGSGSGLPSHPGTSGINPSIPATAAATPSPVNPALRAVILGQHPPGSPFGPQLSPEIAQMVHTLFTGQPPQPFSTRSPSPTGSGVTALPPGTGASVSDLLAQLGSNPGAANTSQVVGSSG